MPAACARLVMRDEWEIYISWQREWLETAMGKEKRRNRIRRFMQMVAEYWRNTQPARSQKQWGFMAEVVNPTLLSDEDKELIEAVS